jgi:Protein of unknown function (DUF3795)
MKTKNDSPPDKKLPAVCGLFCPACTLFIGTAENEPQRLKAVADVYGTTSDVWECNGCCSEKRRYFCKNECKMVECAAEKGIDFCVECDRYPCDELLLSSRPVESQHRHLWPFSGSKRHHSSAGIRVSNRRVPEASY